MSIESTRESSSLQSNELSDGSSTNTLSLFEDSIFKDAHDAFEVHLDKNPVEQTMLDRCLMSGLQIVQKQEQELSQVAPTLQLLLKFGAQWINDALLENEVTPYHLICQSSGDHHELLDLMLLSSGRALIDKEDGWNRTALLYAIRSANINCVTILLKNGANVNHFSAKSTNRCQSIQSPLVEAIITKFGFKTLNLCIIQRDIFDLLLASGADVNKPCDKDSPPPVLRALNCGNLECMKKLLQRGVRLGRTPYGDNYVWAKIVEGWGKVEVLKSIIEHGIDKDSTDTDGRSMLLLAIERSDVEAVRYLLDLGVTLPTYQQEAEHKPCQKCGTNRLYISRDHKQVVLDPCIAAISMGNLDIIQLLEKHGTQSFNSFDVFRSALHYPEVTEYLLNEYTYPLNTEYTANDANIYVDYQSDYWTLLMEACYSNSVDVAKMLLDHGADPNKRMCQEKCFSAINIAIYQCNVEVVAHLIRSGLDINSRSYHYVHGYVLPFEAAVLDGNLDAAKMLLVSGSSCGVYSLNSKHKLKANYKLDLLNFIKNWDLYSNTVNPLELQCRRAILIHLSPQAHKKIKDLPLPHCIIQYLSIPELDDMVDL